MTVIGTRPEIIRLSSVIKLLDEQESIQHVLVHTGQNYDYELNGIFFDDLGLRKPDYFLDAAKNTAIQTIAGALISLEPIIINEKPDAFLVLGDTNSALTAMVAKKYKVPIFHMEAGNRCFDERVPEETNRKIVDHIADINLPYSSIAREYLLNEGIPADRIIKTGSPMKEVIESQFEKITNSKIVENLNIVSNNYFLVSLHREENVDNQLTLSKLIDSLSEIVNTYNLPIIFSVHPRTQKRLEALKLQTNKKIQFHKAFSFSDYCNLQMNAKAVISDSGTISEETYLLKLNSINLREAHERPEAMEAGVIPMVGLDKRNILNALQYSLSKHNMVNNVKDIVPDYEYNHVSKTVLNVILSYTQYINNHVWKK